MKRNHCEFYFLHHVQFFLPPFLKLFFDISVHIIKYFIFEIGTLKIHQMFFSANMDYEQIPCHEVFF